MSKTTNQEILLYYQKHQRHKFFFLVAVSVIILSLLGISFVTLKVYGAASVLFSLTINQQSSAGVTSQESVEIIGSSPTPGILAYLTAPAPTSEPEPQKAVDQPVSNPKPVEIKVNFFDSQNQLVPNGAISNLGGGQVIVPKIDTSRPKFQGNVGIAKAYIFLELHSDPVPAITASFYADDQGNWSWQAPRDIALGPHSLYLTVFDPAGQIKLGELNTAFEIITPTQIRVAEEEKEIKTKQIVLPPSYLDQRLVLFDINVKLSGSLPYQIQPGEEIYAQVDLLNIGQPGVLVDTIVNYRILDQAGKVVYEEKETVAVSKQLSYLKVFSTKPSFPAGDYQLETSVLYGQGEAISTVAFNVFGDAVLILPGKAKLNVTSVIQTLAILFSLAVLIAYAEYSQVSGLSKTLKQITEQDLKKEKLIS